MSNRHWDHGVIVVRDGRDELIVVATTQEALDMLRNHWPSAPGPAHQTAIETCLAVAERCALPTDARAAFVKAAIEAGIPLQV